eukprot:gene20582-22608_t
MKALLVLLLLLCNYIIFPALSLPHGCRFKRGGRSVLYCKGAGFKEIPANIPTKVVYIDLSENPLLRFRGNYFLQFSELRVLRLNGCQLKSSFMLPGSLTELEIKKNRLSIRALKEILKSNSSNLVFIDISHNELDLEHVLTFLPSNIKMFFASENKLPIIRSHHFQRFRNMEKLRLESCGIREIESRSFDSLLRITVLYFNNNKLKTFPDNLFKHLRTLRFLFLMNNEFTRLPDLRRVRLIKMSMSHNKITKIASDDLKEVVTQKLILDNNEISSFDLRNVRCMSIDLSFNRIHTLYAFAFHRQKRLLNLNLQNNNIRRISPMAFKGVIEISSLHLQYNNISILPKGIFNEMSIRNIFLNGNKLSSMNDALDNMRLPPHLLLLFNNPNLTNINRKDYKTMSNQSNIHISCNKLRHISGYERDMKATINCYPFVNFAIFDSDDTLGGNGYTCRRLYTKLKYKCLPCPQGEYSSDKDLHNCQKCPPGSFYQDDLASMDCKKCPTGQYVPPNRAPGKSPTDCQTCPDGTQKINSAGYRACKCLDEFTRVDRFGKCTKCDQRGIQCKHDYPMLKPGYWWDWQGNTKCKNSFIAFMRNLDIEDDSYSRETSKFDCSLPQPHPCRVKGSCLGGVNATCLSNYTGVLCSVCEKGYSRQFENCIKCPKPWYAVLQFVGYIVLFLFICAIISWTDKIRIQVAKNHTRTFADIILSNLKILIGFYQVLVVIMNVFSHVSWPLSFQKTIGVFQFVQLEVLRIPSLRCINAKWRLNAVDEFWIAIIATAGSPIVIAMYFSIKTIYLFFASSSREDFNERKKMCKRNCLRLLALFLFVTYPLTSQRIIQVLPINCHDICTSMKDGKCTHHLFYMRADYSMECLSLSNNSHTLVAAYIFVIIPLGLPLLLFCLLLKYVPSKVNKNEMENEVVDTDYFVEADNVTLNSIMRRRRTGRRRRSSDNSSNDGGSRERRSDLYDTSNEDDESTLQFALKFLYENYDSSNRYWEALEMLRKLIMTAGVTLFIGYYKTGISVTIIVAGFFAVLHAFRRPVRDGLENMLQLLSLSIIPINLCIGAILKSCNGKRFEPHNNDNAIIGYILIALNLFVLVFVIVRLVYGIVKASSTICNAFLQWLKSGFTRCCPLRWRKHQSHQSWLLE